MSFLEKRGRARDQEKAKELKRMKVIALPNTDGPSASAVAKSVREEEQQRRLRLRAYAVAYQALYESSNAMRLLRRCGLAPPGVDEWAIDDVEEIPDIDDKIELARLRRRVGLAQQALRRVHAEKLARLRGPRK